MSKSKQKKGNREAKKPKKQSDGTGKQKQNDFVTRILKGSTGS